MPGGENYDDGTEDGADNATGANLIGGHYNTVKGNNNIVAGKGNNTLELNNVLVAGAYADCSKENLVLALGNGKKGTPSNAFYVTSTGEGYLGDKQIATKWQFPVV